MKNPHKLTIRQHILPRKTIERFYNNNQKVEVCYNSKKISVNANNGIFYSKRIWDQRAENGFMKDIEDKFQQLADTIILEDNIKFNNDDMKIITDFYLLWWYRIQAKNIPIPNTNLKNVLSLSHSYSEDESQRLEKNHITAIQEKGKEFFMPSHHLTGVQIQRAIMNARSTKKFNWTIVRSEQKEFIVPEITEIAYVPVSPKICLLGNESASLLNDREVLELNKELIHYKPEYYFACDLNNCL